MLLNSDTLVIPGADSPYIANPLIGWDNIVTTSNIDSTTEDTEFPVSNLANPATDLKWQGGVNTGDEYITITNGNSELLDYVAIAKHNLGTISAIVSIEKCTNLANSPQVWTEIFQQEVMTDDTPTIFRFTPTSPQGIRVRIQPDVDYPEIAVLYAGSLLLMERSVKVDVKHTPFPLGTLTKVVNGFSESGNFLGRTVVNTRKESTAQFDNITSSFYRDEFNDFIDASRDTPFFFAWAPDDYPEDVGFAWTIADPIPELDTVTDRFGITLKMQGLA